MIYKYLEAPVTVAQIEGAVQANVSDEAMARRALEMYVEDANHTTELTHHMVSVDPEKDRDVVKIDGRVCEYGGVTLRATGLVDLAIFAHSQDERKSA